MRNEYVWMMKALSLKKLTEYVDVQRPCETGAMQ